MALRNPCLRWCDQEHGLEEHAAWVGESDVWRIVGWQLAEREETRIGVRLGEGVCADLGAGVGFGFEAREDAEVGRGRAREGQG